MDGLLTLDTPRRETVADGRVPPDPVPMGHRRSRTLVCRVLEPDPRHSWAHHCTATHPPHGTNPILLSHGAMPWSLH